jgi:hypothetical protein
MTLIIKPLMTSGPKTKRPVKKYDLKMRLSPLIMVTSYQATAMISRSLHGHPSGKRTVIL